jgi:hypothetical protein
MSELTTEQQNAIEASFSLDSDEELLYVSSRDATVSSIFGTLKIEKLRWIVASKVARPKVSAQTYSASRAPNFSIMDVETDSDSSAKFPNPSTEPLGVLRRIEYSRPIGVPPDEHQMHSQERSLPRLLSSAGPSEYHTRPDKVLWMERYRQCRAMSDSTDSLSTGSMVTRPPTPPKATSKHLESSPEIEEMDDPATYPSVLCPKDVDVVEPFHHAVEGNEDDIVNELLVRWTIS